MEAPAGAPFPDPRTQASEPALPLPRREPGPDWGQEPSAGPPPSAPAPSTLRWVLERLRGL
jgi:hypothetical protein